MASYAQNRIRQAAAYMARQLALGGISSWNYSTVSAATPASAATTTSQGTRTVRIIQERMTQLTQVLPQYPAGSVRYRLHADAGTDLAVGGLLTSGDYAFTISALESAQGWLDGIVEVTQ